MSRIEITFGAKNLHVWINHSIHYTDDTTLFSKGNNLDDLIDFTNTELVKLDNWVCANKLSLNIIKTAFSVCSTKSVTNV